MRGTGHLIAHWVSRELSIAGRLWPSAWLNQRLCGVSGHIREPSAQRELEEGIPTEKTFTAIRRTDTVPFHYWSTSHFRSLSFLAPFLKQKVYLFELNSEVMSLASKNSEWPTPMFIAPINSRTCFMREINELANDVLYMHAWWINLHFSNVLWIFPCSFFFFCSLSLLFLNLEGKSTSARSENKQSTVWIDTLSERF